MKGGMKWIAIFVFITMILTSLATFFYYSSSPKFQEKTLLSTPKIKIGNVTLDLEMASTSAERELGLSGRSGLAEGKGLFFIFEKQGKYGFWMKDMKFPIDIIWLDDNYKVTGLKENALPSSYPDAFYPQSDSLYVLEANTGLIKSQNLKIGTQLEFIN